jgi:hypothetical protein
MLFGFVGLASLKQPKTLSGIETHRRWCEVGRSHSLGRKQLKTLSGIETGRHLHTASLYLWAKNHKNPKTLLGIEARDY